MEEISVALTENNVKSWINSNKDKILQTLNAPPPNQVLSEKGFTSGWVKRFGDKYKKLGFGQLLPEELKVFREFKLSEDFKKILNQQQRESFERYEEDPTVIYERQEQPMLIPEGEDLPSTGVIRPERQPDEPYVERLIPDMKPKEGNPHQDFQTSEYLGGNFGKAMIISGLVSGLIPTGYEVARDVVSYFSKPSRKDEEKSTIINIRQSQTQRQAKNFFHKTIKH